MKAFAYPLPLKALSEFTHPAEWHGLHHARRHGAEVLAGNGYVALRVRKGMWLAADHEAAGAEFLGRIGKLPWTRFDSLNDDWRAMDSAGGRLFAPGQIDFWLRDKPAPTPVWRVNDTLLVRVSLLQLIARLPRCECYTGRQSHGEHLFFRFSGGVGIIAADARLTMASGELFGAARDLWSGERLERRKGPRPSFSLPGKPWPPEDLSES